MSDLQIHALVSENPVSPEKPPIVLIHGLAISSRYFIPAITEMEKRAQVFAPELPGWGDSSKPRRALNVAELADALADWMRVVGIRRAALVGHSFGAQIAAEFAAKYPEKIDKLVLASPTCEKNRRNLFTQVGRFLLNSFFEPISLVFIALRDYSKFGMRRGFKTFGYCLRDKIEEKLLAVKKPTLVLRGEFDLAVPNNWTNELAQILPDGKSVTIPGGTHGVPFQSHEEFARQILDFLNY